MREGSTTTLRASTPTAAVTRVVLCGNPGVGKSTLLNALTGRGDFKSGVSIGGGLTRRTRVVNVNGVEYVDTPGLADVEQGHSAAEHVSSALSATNRDVKLLFVTTLESGAVRPTDVQTIRSVCEGIERAGASMQDRVIVIVNKCDPHTLSALRRHDVSTNESGLRRAVRKAYGQTWGAATILALPMRNVNDMIPREEDTAIMRALLDCVKPLAIPRAATVTVVYKDAAEEARRARDLHASVATLQAAVAAVQRERTRAGVFVFVGVGIVVGLIGLARILGKRSEASQLV